MPDPFGLVAPVIGFSDSVQGGRGAPRGPTWLAVLFQGCMPERAGPRGGAGPGWFQIGSGGFAGLHLPDREVLHHELTQGLLLAGFVCEGALLEVSENLDLVPLASPA